MRAPPPPRCGAARPGRRSRYPRRSSRPRGWRAPIRIVGGAGGGRRGRGDGNWREASVGVRSAECGVRSTGCKEHKQCNPAARPVRLPVMNSALRTPHSALRSLPHGPSKSAAPGPGPAPRAARVPGPADPDSQEARVVALDRRRDRLRHHHLVLRERRAHRPHEHPGRGRVPRRRTRDRVQRGRQVDQVGRDRGGRVERTSGKRGSKLRSRPTSGPSGASRRPTRRPTCSKGSRRRSTTARRSRSPS